MNNKFLDDYKFSIKKIDENGNDPGANSPFAAVILHAGDGKWIDEIGKDVFNAIKGA